MHHAADQRAAPQVTTTRPHASAMTQDTASLSSNSSPKSQKAPLDPTLSQVSESTLASAGIYELTPPSSVASAHEQQVRADPTESTRLINTLSPASVNGKKRTANGQMKGTTEQADELEGFRHVRTANVLSQLGSSNVGELSQQLRTKLTYAMVKVQHGWQRHSLDEIESIASQSPRSNLSGLGPRNFQSMVSPRSAIAASKRQNSNTSSSSDRSLRQLPIPTLAPAVNHSMTSPCRALAPPAPIIAGNRRKPTPNANLQINSSLKSSPRATRPVANQRTPSQNAVLEADAVETLLFMSASPGNSGHFPSHLSAYSPTSQVFSTQASPLKTQFSPHDRRYSTNAIGYSPPRSTRRCVRHEDKAALIDRLLNDLDDSESEELDRAVQIMERHHAAKLST